MNSHTPITITAELESGISLGTPWGIALDGLLASVMHTRARAELEDAGGHHTPVLERDDIDDLPLPLARCTADPAHWHWMATCAHPAPTGHDDDPLDIRTWYSMPDHHRLEALVDELPNVVDDDRGRWRRHAVPLLIHLTPAVTWQAVGDPDLIDELLRDLRAIGKKRAIGEGAVRRWIIQPAPALDPWTAGHLHPDGTLGRPVPPTCLHGHDDILTGPTGTTALRPPYLHPSRRARCTQPRPWIDPT